MEIRGSRAGHRGARLRSKRRAGDLRATGRGRRGRRQARRGARDQTAMLGRDGRPGAADGPSSSATRRCQSHEAARARPDAHRGPRVARRSGSRSPSEASASSRSRSGMAVSRRSNVDRFDSCHPASASARPCPFSAVCLARWLRRRIRSIPSSISRSPKVPISHGVNGEDAGRAEQERAGVSGRRLTPLALCLA